MLRLLGPELGRPTLDDAWFAAQSTGWQHLLTHLAQEPLVQARPILLLSALKIGQIPLEDADGMGKAEAIHLQSLPLLGGVQHQDADGKARQIAPPCTSRLIYVPHIQNNS